MPANTDVLRQKPQRAIVADMNIHHGGHTGGVSVNATEKVSEYRFENFCFCPQTLELKKDGVATALKLQPARLLNILLQHAPNVVLRTTIYEGLWGNRTTVEFDQSLNACIRQLRNVLGDSATNPKLIETLPKRGYRFLAVVKTKGAPNRLRRIAGGAVVAAAAIGTITLLSLESSPATEPLRLYVAPIEIVDAPSDAPVSLIQYGLRLSIVDQLTRNDDNSLLTVNGETLWADEQVLGLRDDRDYRLIIHVNLERNAYLANVKLVRGGDDNPSGERAFEMEKVDANGLANASMEIAQWAASYLGSSLASNRAIIPDVDPKYFDAIIKAKRARQLGSRPALQKSLEYGEKALAINPASTEAKGLIGIVLVKLAGGEGFPANHTYARALKYADEIHMAIGPTVESELIRGRTALYYEWDLPKAESAFDQALELAPGNAMVHLWHAGLLAAKGMTIQAAESVDMSLQLNPLSMAVASDRCWYLGVARRFEEAVDACSWALELAPGHGWATVGLSLALEKLDRDDEAYHVLAPLVEALSKTEELAGNSLLFQSLDGNPLSDVRDLHCAIADLSGPPVEGGRYTLFAHATFNARCGRMTVAADLLVKAHKRGEPFILFYNIEPRLDEFRVSPEAKTIDMTISVRQHEKTT